MIDFAAFSDELQKIAQYDPNRKAKLIGGAAGMGLGAASAHKLVGKVPGKARLVAMGVGGLVGALGGREVAEGAVTAGRGLRATAAHTRHALR